MDLIEEIRKKCSPIVCVADQAPFEVGGNVFGVLIPLLTHSRQRFKDLEQDFPNRGRVWWRLAESVDEDTVLPGSLWTIQIELAVDYEPRRAEKDYYQARWKDVVPGTRSYAEVLVQAGDPVLDRLLADGVPVDHPPNHLVVVAGPDSYMGPFQTTWDRAGRRAMLRVIDRTRPVVHRLPRGLVPAPRVHTFRLPVNRWDKRHPERIVEVQLMDLEDLEVLRGGTLLDALNGPELVNWGLKLAGTTKRDRQAVKSAIDGLDQVGADEGLHGQRLERLRCLLSSRHRVLELGTEVAALVADQEAFRELVERHIEGVTADRVREEVKKREAMILTELEGLRLRKERLESELDGLEGVTQARLREEELRFQAENASRIRALEESEKAIGAAEERLAYRERELEARLQRLIEQYRTESDTLIDRILAELPLLARLGGNAAPPKAGDVTQQARLRLPGFLEQDRARGGLSEREFIDQFKIVCARRGFVFDQDDLVNFHVSVKTGCWTVLAGPSGTGKSSLPRLYAEALGVTPELLWIPVRPDWVDDRDVLGAFNPLSGRFEPASSGLVDRLIAASEDLQRRRGGIYLICLDEMNLARVEHYFSQFLSVLERPQTQRTLSLFAPGLESSGDAYARWRQITVPETVRFVGTVNIDETTHFFSPKVLDRASILTLEEPRLGDGIGSADDTPRVAGVQPVHWDEYHGWIRPPQIVGDTLSILTAMNAVLEPHRQGLGYRTRDRILAFVASAAGLLDHDRSIDLALSQFVLPRVRAGTSNDERMIEEMTQQLPAVRFPRSSRILDRMAAKGGDHDFFQVV